MEIPPPSKRNDWAVRGLLALAMVAYIFFVRDAHSQVWGTIAYGDTAHRWAATFSGSTVSVTNHPSYPQWPSPDMVGTWVHISGTGASSIYTKTGTNTYPRFWTFTATTMRLQGSSDSWNYILVTGGSLVFDNPLDVTGELSLSDFESIDYAVKVDTDDDGIPDTVVQTGTIRDGEGWSFEPGPGVAWEVRAVSGNIFTDGPPRKIPLDQIIGGGEGASSEPVEVTMSGTTFSPIDHVSIDSGGTVTKTPILQGQTTVNGSSSTYYSYQNSIGGMTSVIYSGTGSNTVTNNDIQRSTVQNSAENERIIKAIGQLETAVKASGSNTVVAITGTATAEPTPLPDGDDVADNALSPVPSSPDLSAAATGTATNSDLPTYNGEGSEFWIIPIPSFMGGGQIDVNPLSVPLVVTVADWIRVLFVLIITFYVISINYRNSEGMVMVINTAQPGSTLGATATEISGWAGTAVMVGISIGVRLLIMAVLPSFFTLLAGYSEIEGSGSVSALWFLGGKDVVASIGAHVASGSSSSVIQAALELLDAFFPIEFALTAAANVLGYFVLTLFIALAYGTWVKFFPR